MGPIAHVPHHPCPPSRSNRYWQYSLNTWSCTCSPCAHVISQVSKRCQVVKKMSSCQKDVKCQKIKHLDYGGGSQKNKLTQWGSQILTSILMSHMMVTKNYQNVHRKYFWAILVTFIFDIKIDVNICEPHDVNLFFLWTSSIVCIFDFFIFDIFLTTWHLFDTWLITWAHGEHVQDHVFNEYCQYLLDLDGAQGWRGTWAMGTKKMSSCQKDVKLSKRCQMSKNQTPGLWRRFTKKINWHNEVHRYWHQFWHHIWWSLKTIKMFTESIFGQFWWPSYLTSKLMSISVNLMMSIYFFCEPPP